MLQFSIPINFSAVDLITFEAMLVARWLRLFVLGNRLKTMFTGTGRQDHVDCTSCRQLSDPSI